MPCELAQLNVAEPLAPMDSAVMAAFAAQLEPVNALADAAEGFVWRLQTEAGDATALRIGDDLMVNLSTWTSLSALSAFVFGGLHLEVMRRRREWFAPMRQPYLCLWWVAEGHRPTVEEAEDRLATLRALGPGPGAFTIRQHFPPPP